MKKFLIMLLILIVALFAIFKGYSPALSDEISNYLLNQSQTEPTAMPQHNSDLSQYLNDFGPVTDEIASISISSGDDLMEQFIDVMYSRVSAVKVNTPRGTEEFYMNELKEQMPRFTDISEMRTKWITYSGSCTVDITYNDSVTVMAYLEGKTQSLSEENLALLNEAQKVHSSITNDSMNNYDKIKAFHDYLINYCTYKDTGDRSHSAVGALIDGQAVCEGYTEAFDLLCYLSGIECIEIDGTAQNNTMSGPHAWNKVKLDNIWYNVDVTWDDPISSSPMLRYDYFLVSDDKMTQDHQWYLYPHIPNAGINYNDLDKILE